MNLPPSTISVGIFLLCLDTLAVIAYQSSISKLTVNSSSLSITSFLFNPRSSHSPWVDRLLGSKSVFYKYDGVHPLSERPLSKTEIELRHQTIKHHKLPEFAIWPVCSFEILGYSLLGVDSPFLGSEKLVSPSFGHALLMIGQWTIPCFYRGTYENWRGDSEYTTPNYWATFFYCPFYDGNTRCAAMQSYMATNERFTAQIKMFLKSTEWTSIFSVNYIDRDLVRKSSAKNKFGKIAVCTIIPYTSSDPSKSVVNNAILAEWIRHYSSLGITPIIYDRDGANQNAIFGHSAYKEAQGIVSVNNESTVIYHNYTIRGLLDPSKRGMKYDNSELPKNGLDKSTLEHRLSRFEAQGHDKTLTFTQCRFEAKAVHDFETVLVVDFDEFLYCSPAQSTRESQRKYIHDVLIAGNKVIGHEQLSVPQRLLYNKTTNARDCLVEAAASGRSIFSCFASYQFYIGGHSSKSIHLGHFCPLTNYHQSCANDAPRAYNCLCQNYRIRPNNRYPHRANEPGRECSFLHISSNSKAYNANRYPLQAEDMISFKKSVNELQRLHKSTNT